MAAKNINIVGIYIYSSRSDANSKIIFILDKVLRFCECRFNKNKKTATLVSLYYKDLVPVKNESDFNSFKKLLEAVVEDFYFNNYHKNVNSIYEGYTKADKSIERFISIFETQLNLFELEVTEQINILHKKIEELDKEISLLIDKDYNLWNDVEEYRTKYGTKNDAYQKLVASANAAHDKVAQYEKRKTKLDAEMRALTKKFEKRREIVANIRKL